MTTLGTKYQQAQNWSARLPIAEDIFAEVRAESLAGSPIVQGPFIAQIQDETIVDIGSLSDAELDALTAPKASTC